jgi:hypothetical protein
MSNSDVGKLEETSRVKKSIATLEPTKSVRGNLFIVADCANKPKADRKDFPEDLVDKSKYDASWCSSPVSHGDKICVIKPSRKHQVAEERESSQDERAHVQKTQTHGESPSLMTSHESSCSACSSVSSSGEAVDGVGGDSQTLGTRPRSYESEDSKVEHGEDYSSIPSDNLQEPRPMKSNTGNNFFRVLIRPHPLRRDPKSTSGISVMKHGLKQDPTAVIGFSCQRGPRIDEDPTSFVSHKSTHNLLRDQAAPRTYIDKIQLVRNAKSREGGSDTAAMMKALNRQAGTESSVLTNAMGGIYYNYLHPGTSTPQPDSQPMLQRVPSRNLPPNFPHLAVRRFYSENGLQEKERTAREDDLWSGMLLRFVILQ